MIPKHLQIILLCVDDKDKPHDIVDFPKRGKLYEAEDIIKNSKMDGTHGYVLKGLYPQGKYGTYKSDRFEIFSTIVLN